MFPCACYVRVVSSACVYVVCDVLYDVVCVAVVSCVCVRGLNAFVCSV